jgi:hypothetical protein
MSDEIIQDLWQAKDRIAKECTYDISALAAELRKRQEQPGRKTVSPPKKNTGQFTEKPE